MWGPWFAAGRPARSPLSTRASIAVVSLGPGHFVLFDVGRDGHLYVRVRNHGRWTRWGGVGRPPASPLSSTARVTAFSRGQGHFVVYGVGRDGRLYVRAWRRVHWTRWATVGRPAGSPLSTTAPVSVTGSRAVEIVRAVGQDGQAYQRAWNGRAWEPWVELARPAASALSPSARIVPVRLSGERLLLLALGQDGVLYLRARIFGRWAPWGAVGRPDQSALSIAADIVVTNVAVRRFNIFAVGQDGQLYRRSWSGTWAPWEAISRPAESALSTNARIAAIFRTPLHEDVLGVGQDGQLYQRSRNGGVWGSWLAMGRPAASALSTGTPIVVIPVSRGRFALLAIGQDGQLYGVAPPAVA